MERTIEVKVIPVKHQLVIGIVTTLATIAVNKLVSKGYDSIVTVNRPEPIPEV